MVAAIWGAAFVAQRSAMQHMGPFLFNGIRFLLAAFMLWLISRSLGKSSFFRLSSFQSGLPLGLVLFASASLQQVGVVSTSAGKAGFITGLYILFVPLILLVWKRRRTKFNEWLGIMAAVVGLFLLSVSEALSISRGDLWVLLCAAGFGLHVVLVGEYVKSVEPFALAFWQFLITGLASLVIAVGSETLSSAGIATCWLEILYAGILSAGVGYTVQSIAQQRTTAVTAGVILSLESVFAALTGWLLLNEILNIRQVLGCALMLVGTVLAQLPCHPREAAVRG